MEKPSPLLAVLLIADIAMILTQCAPEACFEETNSFLKATFYDNSSKKQLAPDSLTLFGLDRQTEKIYDKASQIQPAMFPLDASADTCTFIIRINGITDTLEFIYSSYPHLISKECGYTFYHNLDTFFYSKNSIDYIYRSSNSITTSNYENIRIFY